MPETEKSAESQAKKPDVVRGRITLTGGDEPLHKVIVSVHDFDPYRLIVGRENTPYLGEPWTRLKSMIDSGGFIADIASGLAETFLARFLGNVGPENRLDTLAGFLGELPNPRFDPGSDPIDPLEVFLDPFWMLGERIGSVQPDESGAFLLEYDANQTRRGDPSGRPDLLLAVLAPSETSNLITTFTSAGASAPMHNLPPVPSADFTIPLTGSPFSRLLSLTFAGRANAGAEETYLIRIDRDLAIKHEIAPAGIVILGADENLPPMERIDLEFKKRQERRELDDYRRQKLLQLRRPMIEKARARTRNAHSVVQGLSSLPEAEFLDPLVIPDVGTLNDKNARRKEARSARRVDSESRYGVRYVNAEFEMSENSLASIIGTVDTSGAQVSIPYNVVCRLVHQASGGHELIRTRSLADVQAGLARWSQEQPTSTSTVSPTTQPSDEGGDDGNQAEEGDIPPPPEPTIEEKLKRTLEALISQVSLGEDRTTDVSSTAATILRADLEAGTLYKGPADTTAYHDFQSLQIAYADVWKEALSGALQQSVEALMVQLSLEVEDLPDNNQLDELLSLEREELEQWIGGIVTNPELMTDEAKLLWPEQTSFWDNLQPSIQKNLNNIALEPFQIESDVFVNPDGSATNIAYYHSNVSLFTMFPPGTTEPPSSTMNLDGFSMDARFDVAETIIRQINSRINVGLEFIQQNDNLDRSTSRLGLLKRQLNERLQDKFSFKYFDPGSYNFGVVSTYRQKWVPGPYQVGDLVSTIPLAPGEIRKYSTKETMKVSRATKEQEKSLSTIAGESTTKSSVSSDIVARAEAQNQFKIEAKGGLNIGIGTFDTTSNFSTDQKSYSQDTKKRMREAVVKASHEYKNERTMEVNTNAESEAVRESSGELKNPNNELSVTYLLYELERQYEISEKLHSLTPVVMIANEMPSPDGITEAWLLEHEWILRRVLLDDALLPALDGLTDGFVSDEVSLGILKTNWKTQTEVVSQLQGEHLSFSNARRRLENKLIGAKRAEAHARAIDDAPGFLFDVVEAVGGVNFGGVAVDQAAAAVEAAEQQLQNVQREVEQLSAKLNGAQSALNQATLQVTDALKEQSQQRVNIDQLKVHVKQNILHYMQAIWSHEPPEQTYMRLHMKKIAVPQSGTAQARGYYKPAKPHDWMPGREESIFVIESIDPPVWRPDNSGDEKYLHEVADLDRPMGFKGNYTIFPLKQCSFITDYMMIEYVDSYFGIRDPDALGEHTTEELIEYRKTADLSDDQKEALNIVITKRLQENIQDTGTIIVPSRQLYMEALLGSHSLLEPFKKAHRAYDALAAKEGVRKLALENMRYAARLIKEDPELGDPDVDKVVEKRTV